MRYDTEICFQKIIKAGEYDTSTGNYEQDEIKEYSKHADVTDSGTEMMNIVYGCVKKGSKTIRLQTHYNDRFDYIRIGSKRYHVDYERRLRVKHIFVVSEVS